MGGGGGVSIWRLLAGVRLRRREGGVGPAAPPGPPKARPALAGVRPSPEKERKSAGVVPFCPSAVLLSGVKSRETPCSRGAVDGVGNAILAAGGAGALLMASGGSVVRALALTGPQKASWRYRRLKGSSLSSGAGFGMRVCNQSKMLKRLR